MSKSNVSSTGISTLGLLGVVFVALKLTGYIDWSWWLVTLPFWGGLGAALALIFAAGLVCAICGLIVWILEMKSGGLKK